MTKNAVEVASIILKDHADSGVFGCQRCNTPLVGENGSEANLRYKLCLEHLTMVLGDGIGQEAMAFLLARGTIMVCYYSRISAYKIRVEARSSKRSELAMLERQFGVGRIYRHQGTMLRWSCASLKDLHRMGSILMPAIPEFGILLQAYVVQPDRPTRSAYAEAFMTKMGKRSIRLISYL